MTRFCSNCGQPIVDDTKFCTNCGAPVPPLAEPQPEPQQQYYNRQTQQQSYSPEPQQQYYNQQPQQSYQASPDPGEKPNNRLGQAIALAIIFCVPLGIPGIVNAAKVDALWKEGKYEEARSASRKANMWSLIAMGAGILFIFFYIFLFVAEEL